MPVRKIKPSYTVVTGSISSNNAENHSEFEGPLEWQFLILLEFDWNNEIDRYETQPVKISYRDKQTNRQRSYTPDVLVHYRDNRPPCLFEVKPRYYLFKKWNELRPKLRAGIHYAATNNMCFKIITDKEIFTPFLDNARFLRSFKFLSQSDADIQLLMHAITQTGPTTPNSLLKSITNDIWRQAELIPSLWNLIANRQIGTDIHVKLHMESPIYPVQPE